MEVSFPNNRSWRKLSAPRKSEIENLHILRYHYHTVSMNLQKINQQPKKGDEKFSLHKCAGLINFLIH